MESILEIFAHFLGPHLDLGLLVAIINNLVVIATEFKTRLCVMTKRLSLMKRLCSKDYR